MRKVTVKVGFVGSYRFRCTPWCQKMRDNSLAALAGVAGVEVVVPRPSPDGVGVDAEKGHTPHGMVANLDEAEAVADYFASHKVNALILCPLDFGDERSAAKIAERLQVPVLLYATKEPPAPDGPAMERTSDSYCGSLSMASALYRRKLIFHFAGVFFLDEPAFREEVKTFVAAVAVVTGMRNARIGQVGVRPATFETVGYDEAALIQKFGQNVIYAELADVVRTAEGYADDDQRVQQAIARLKASVAEVTVSEHHVVNSAKLEVALADFWTRARLSAMAVQCWPSIQAQMGISVCALYGRLTGQGMLTACETDVLGALAMLVSYQSAMGETVPHFIDWTIQHRENPNWLLAWHCGNAPSCLARDPARTALRSRNDMTGTMPIAERDPMSGLAQFQIKPGRVTFCRLVEYDNAWKMLITTGEIIPSEETLAGTWAWVQVKDHARLYRTLVEEGFVHHASMIHGDQTQVLILACKFLGIRPVIVE
jgi:L-fucose isomerase-like protein